MLKVLTQTMYVHIINFYHSATVNKGHNDI